MRSIIRPAALTALGVISAFMPLFGYGWQAMTQDPETHFRHELGKRINKHKTDEANLILMLQLADMLDCHCLHITLPYALSGGAARHPAPPSAALANNADRSTAGG